MTDADDDIAKADKLEVELSKAMSRATAAKARFQRQRTRYEQALSARERGPARFWMNAAGEAVTEAEAEVRKLRKKLAQLRNREDQHAMRQEQQATTTLMTPPGPDWVLTVCKAGGLRFGHKQYRNGQEIDVAEITKSLNGDRLLSSGYLRWRPRSALFPKSAPAASGLAAPVAAAPGDDPLVIARRALSEAAKRRGTTMRDCIDVIDSGVLTRAIKAIADTPREARVGSWGGGGGTLQRVGQGTLRRPVDDAIDILCAPPERESAP
jgi:hypothetical protein